jgi:hypothetical protein
MQVSPQASSTISTLVTLAPIVTGGLAGALLTYILKVWSEKRQRKIISIKITDLRLTLPSNEAADLLPTDSLKITFEDQVFKHLRLYTAFVKNIGNRGVEGMKLAVSFPKETTLIRTMISSEPLSINCTLENQTQTTSLELVHSFGRLEVGDRIRLSFLIDTLRSKEIVCLPRGVDDVEFQIDKDEYLERSRDITVAPAFKLIFLTTIILTLLSFTIAVVIAIAAPQTPEYSGLMETLSTTWKLGFGTILGLLAGKVLP